jgi:hypothetical protein
VPDAGQVGAVKIDLGRGAATRVERRRDGGVVINQGTSRIYLGCDELKAVLVAIHALTNGSPNVGRQDQNTRNGIQ